MEEYIHVTLQFKVESQGFFPLVFMFMFFKATGTIIDPISSKSLFGVHQNIIKWKFYYMWQVQRYGPTVVCLQ